MLQNILNINLGFFINILYYRFFNRIVEKNKNRILKVNTILSLLHSIIISSSTITFFYYDYDLIHFIKYYSIGYIILDLICINKFKELEKGRMVYIFHHLIFINCWLLMEEDTYIPHRVLLCEYSTILMNLRILSKYYFPKYRNIIGILMVFVFFFVRIVNTIDIYFLERSVIHKYNYLYFSYLGLQCYWFSIMMKKIYKLLIDKKKIS